MKTNTMIALGLLGVGGYLYWKNQQPPVVGTALPGYVPPATTVVPPSGSNPVAGALKAAWNAVGELATTIVGGASLATTPTPTGGYGGWNRRGRARTYY